MDRPIPDDKLTDLSMHYGTLDIPARALQAAGITIDEYNEWRMNLVTRRDEKNKERDRRGRERISEADWTDEDEDKLNV